MNKTAMVTGSFDPVTVGHIDIIQRTAAIFDKVYAVILKNPEKRAFFSEEQRFEMLIAATAFLKNVEVKSYDGFAIDFAKENRVDYIVRGVRNSEDFQYELEMRNWNMSHGKIETIFLASDEKFCDVSSTKAKELILKDDFSLVPNASAKLIKQRG